MEVFQVHTGQTPLLISIPHAGTYVPPDLIKQFTAKAQALPDTDWHVPILYNFVESLSVTRLIATHSRYVIDLNRSPAGDVLYPDQTNTELVPLTTFDGSPVYPPGQEPTTPERQRRLKLYWEPYHQQLKHALVKIKQRHGYAILLDAHSIRSKLPRLFTGTLPDLNFGTAEGKSTPASLIDHVLTHLGTRQPPLHPYRIVVNGRFKGGYITRHYGQPAQQIYALQLELAQKNYMQETSPYTLQNSATNHLRTTLQAIVDALLNWSP